MFALLLIEKDESEEGSAHVSININTMIMSTFFGFISMSDTVVPSVLLELDEDVEHDEEEEEFDERRLASIACTSCMRSSSELFVSTAATNDMTSSSEVIVDVVDVVDDVVDG